ncbi:MAG: hypothetical protein ABIB55_01175 [Candidatus Nealsonbacteria bacterium]
MVTRKSYYEKNQPIHIISRSLIDAFRQKEDCFKFIFYFYTANLGKRGHNLSPRDIIKAGQSILYGEKIPSKFVIIEHKPMVHLLDFSFVINHDHLYLLLNIENMLPNFMQKVNNSFAQSFNISHNRKDAVFGRRYKGVAIENDFQSHAVSRYVSIINPLDVFQPGWREGGLKNPKKAFNFLNNYEFSSFPDKVGKRSSLILAPKEILEQYAPFWGKNKEYQDFVKEFLKERSTLTHANHIFLE